LIFSFNFGWWEGLVGGKGVRLVGGGTRLVGWGTRTKSVCWYLLSVKVIFFKMRNHQIFGKMPPTVCVKEKHTFFSFLNVGFFEKCARTKTFYRYLLSAKISFKIRNQNFLEKVTSAVCAKKHTFFSFLNIGFFEKCARTKTFYRYLLSVKISFKI